MDVSIYTYIGTFYTTDADNKWIYLHTYLVEKVILNWMNFEWNKSHFYRNVKTHEKYHYICRVLCMAMAKYLRPCKDPKFSSDPADSNHLWLGM